MQGQPTTLGSKHRLQAQGRPNSEANLTDQPLHARIAAAPLVHDAKRAEDAHCELMRRIAGEARLSPLRALCAAPRARALLAGIFGSSPYLTSLIEGNPWRLSAALSSVPERHFAALTANLTRALDACSATASAMQLLRAYKSDVALLTAVCDLAGIWPVMAVAHYLSEAADATEVMLLMVKDAAEVAPVAVTETVDESELVANKALFWAKVPSAKRLAPRSLIAVPKVESCASF